MKIAIYLADKDCAAAYCPLALTAEDAERLRRRPQLAQRTQWRVSRYLKQQAAQTGFQAAWGCLSHSGGAAVWAEADAPVGVDLEQIVPRDFAPWHEWICSADDASWLVQQGQTATAYYRLWTLKEALIKAAGLQWADLAQAGWQQNGSGLVLQAGGRVWQGATFVVAQRYMLSCVWPAEQRAQLQLLPFGCWQRGGCVEIV